MTALYEMTGELISQLSNIQERLESGLEVHQDELDMIISLKDDTEQKALNIGKFIKNLQSDSDQLASEIKRLQAKKKSVDNLELKLKTYLIEQLELLGIDKLGDKVFSIKVQKNPLSVDVADVNFLPAKYIVTKLEADKKALLADYKANDAFSVKGVSFIQNKSLRMG